MGLGLNLAGVDLDKSDFDPIPSDTYLVEIVKAAMKGTKGSEGAALPKDTPTINLELKVVGGEYDKRRVFRQLVIAPEKIGNKKYEHKQLMDRMLGQFFVAFGYSQEEVKSADFDPDIADLPGKQGLAVVGQKPKFNGAEGEMTNEVKGFKPITADWDSDSSGSLL